MGSICRRRSGSPARIGGRRAPPRETHCLIPGGLGLMRPSQRSPGYRLDRACEIERCKRKAPAAKIRPGLSCRIGRHTGKWGLTDDDASRERADAGRPPSITPAGVRERTRNFFDLSREYLGNIRDLKRYYSHFLRIPLDIVYWDRITCVMQMQHQDKCRVPFDGP